MFRMPGNKSVFLTCQFSPAFNVSKVLGKSVKLCHKGSINPKDSEILLNRKSAGKINSTPQL